MPINNCISLITLKSSRIYALAILLFAFSASYGQQKPATQSWHQELTSLMQQFLNCTATSSEKSQCSAFIGESIARVYKLNTFYSEKLHRYLLINEISKPLVEKDQWTLLGPAFDQKAL